MNYSDLTPAPAPVTPGNWPSRGSHTLTAGTAGTRPASIAISRQGSARHRLRRAATLLVAAAFSLLGTLAHAEIAATVNFVSGLVTASGPEAGSRELAKNDNVHSRDTVETAKNGRVQMRFTDGGLVSLMPGTTFSIEEYLFEDQADDDGSLVFGMLRGGLRTVTGSIGKVNHDQYELKTPVATLGIRGTEYTAVLNPPNTLRVHVGRGRVVITNESGELEVPEGRNAVVTMGSAPQFSEQGPQYLATAPIGDTLHTDGEITQDPDALDPLMAGVLLPKGPDDFNPGALPPGSGGGSIPGGPGTPTDPGGTPPPVPPAPPAPVTEWLMAGFAGDSNWQNAQLWTTGTSGMLTDVDFNSTDTQPVAINDSGYDISGLNIADAGASGDLKWGFFHDGSGLLDGNTIDLAGPGSTPVGADYMPYVMGGPAPGQLSGTLEYVLDGATPARYTTWGGPGGTLDHFDFGVDVNTLQYTLDMQVSMPQSASITTIHQFTHPGGSLSTLSGDLGGFQLNNPLCVQGCGNNNDDATIGGFITGPNGEQAGMVYEFGDGGNDGGRITGAAGLKRDNMPVGVGQ